MKPNLKWIIMQFDQGTGELKQPRRQNDSENVTWKANSCSISYKFFNVGDFFFGIDSKGLCLIKFKNEKENYCLLFTSSIDVNETRKLFHVVAVQQRKRNQPKIVTTCKVTLLLSLHITFFCHSRCRRLRRVAQAPPLVSLEGEHSSPAISGCRKNFWYFFADIPRKSSLSVTHSHR